MNFCWPSFMILIIIVVIVIFCCCLSAVLGQNDSSSSNVTTNNNNNTITVQEAVGISPMFLFKCHGVLMTLSWLLFTPCAILFARFLHDPLKRLLGDQLWFQVHRLLNTLTFICVLIAAICVISATGGEWAGPSIYKTSKESVSWPSLHALFGLVAVLLTVFQPVSALFRCHADSSARGVFNVMHAFTGYIGWLCATIAICIACTYFNLFASRTAATVLIIVFLVLLVIIAVLMQCVDIQQNVKCFDQSQLFIVAAVVCCAIATAISLLIIF